MKIDRERLQLLVYKYAGKCQEAQDAKTEMEAAHKEANAVMDEITAYLEEVNAANEKMDGELARLQKAEAERASIKPEPSPAPADDVVAKVCRNCKYIGIDWVKKQRVCQQRHKLVENEDQPCCNLFEPSLTAICAAANRKTLALETAMAAAGTTGTAETPATPGPLKPKPVQCAECKHGEISLIEGTATCKKSGMVFEDYSKFVPCGEFEPKEKDDEPEEPEEDKRCGDCVRYNARNLWCEGHEIPVVASSGACPDYRKEAVKGEEP